MTGSEKRKAIFTQFIEQYTGRFDKEISQIPPTLHLAKALYLFTFTDYFGKIKYVADTGDLNQIGRTRHNFTYLIEKLFPSGFISRKDEIYELYCCGVMHAVYPKNTGLNYLIGNSNLTYREKVGIPSQQYEIDVLNLWKYEQLLKQAISDFSNEVEKGTNNILIDNMYLLLTNDIFGDASSYKKYYP